MNQSAAAHARLIERSRVLIETSQELCSASRLILDSSREANVRVMRLLDEVRLKRRPVSKY